MLTAAKAGGLSHWHSTGWAAGPCHGTRIAKHADGNNDDCDRDLLPQSNARGRCTSPRQLPGPSYFRFGYCSRRLVISLLPLRSLALGAGPWSLGRSVASSRNGSTQVPTLTSHSPSSRAIGSVS